MEYFNTKLENVKVVKVNPVMHDIKNPTYEKHNHLEQVELRYEKITRLTRTATSFIPTHGVSVPPRNSAGRTGHPVRHFYFSSASVGGC